MSGTDLGHPLTVGDRIWLFFGDTVGAYKSGDRYYVSRGVPAGVGDSIGYLPNTDFSQCRYIQVSTHAPVDDPANPPAIENDGGKFMGVPNVVMTAGALADMRLTRFLPRELQTSDVVLLWGRGWNATRSDMYLAVVSVNDIEAGTSKWFYYAGANNWSSAERDAVGLLNAVEVSQHSVTWNPALNRFVLMRGETGRLVAQFATAPWGPWSTPVTVIASSDEWVRTLMHRPGADQIVESLVPIYNRDGTLSIREEERGVAYSPNVLDRFTGKPPAPSLCITRYPPGVRIRSS